MVGTNGCKLARVSQSEKADLSSDRSLQLDCVKSESLVIADQHAAVNTFSNFALRMKGAWQFIYPDG